MGGVCCSLISFLSGEGTLQGLVCFWALLRASGAYEDAGLLFAVLGLLDVAFLRGMEEGLRGFLGVDGSPAAVEIDPLDSVFFRGIEEGLRGFWEVAGSTATGEMDPLDVGFLRGMEEGLRGFWGVDGPAA